MAAPLYGKLLVTLPEVGTPRESDAIFSLLWLIWPMPLLPNEWLSLARIYHLALPNARYLSAAGEQIGCLEDSTFTNTQTLDRRS